MTTVDVGTRRSQRTAGNDGGLRAWPLRKPALWILAKGGVLLLVLWSVIGLLFVELLDDGPIGDADRAGAEWLEDRRTPTWNSVTYYGSMLSETLVKVALVAVVGSVMVAIWRRWHDGVFLAVVVIFEATIFVISSFIVGRDRPPVERLDEAAPSGSFPSGHSAAAVAFYASLFVIVRWHTQNRAVRSIFAVVAVVVPIVVAVSRTARGMHYPIDVVAGMLLGFASIPVVRAAISAGVDEIDQEATDDDVDEVRHASAAPDRVRRLDLTVPDADRAAQLTG